MPVRWSNTLSELFTVHRLGTCSLLSHSAYKVHMGDISITLNKCRIGCVMGGWIVNNPMHADNLIIIALDTAFGADNISLE